jgi:serine/threonine protein kinase
MDSPSSTESRTISSLIVSPRDYEKIRMIGTGASGVVYLVRRKDGTEEYAMKSVKCAQLNTQQQEYLFREVEIMTQAVHPALLYLVGYSLPQSRDGTAVIVPEYMPAGSVFDIITLDRAGNPPPNWDLSAKLKTIFGIAGGLRFLHSRRIMHRDLKAENILMDAELTPRIGDFGLSRILITGDPKSMTSKIGTPLYMAPELFADAPYDLKVDVYAFGMLTYEILSPVAPFQDVTNPMALGMKIVQGVRPPLVEQIPEPFRRLIHACWASEAQARPDFEAIVSYLADDACLPPGCDRESVIEYRNRVFPGVAVPPSGGSTDQRLEQLQQLIVAQNAAIADLRERLERENAELRTSVSGLQQANGELHDVCAKLRQENDQLQSTIAGHTKKFRTMTTDLKNAALHLDALHREHEETAVQMRGLQETISSLGDRLTALEARAASGTTPIVVVEIDLPFGGDPFDGVFSRWRSSLDRSPCDAGLVVITGSSYDDESQRNLPCLLDVDWDGAWRSERSDQGFLLFYFAAHSIWPAIYSLRSSNAQSGGRHLKSWMLEGSADGETWVESHSIQNDDQLNGDGMAASFYCPERKGPFRYIRLRQTGPSHAGTLTGFSLASIEMFGLVSNVT